MEYFDDRNQNKVKEKSVYLLHLDAPRIIIISSVFIGVLIIAFLFGMNLTKDKAAPGKDILTPKEALIEPLPPEGADKDPLEKGVQLPPAGAEMAGNPPVEDKGLPGANPALNDPLKGKAEVPKTAPATAGFQAKNPTADVLNQENIKEVIPPAAGEVKKVVHPQAKPEKKVARKSVRDKNRKITTDRKAPREKKQRTMEVAAREKPSEVKKTRGGYAIQVGSFDSRAKAQKEASSLKSMRFDAYVENTSVGSKKFYRVKIGPILSRQKAVKMISELQSMNKYEGSYLVKE